MENDFYVHLILLKCPLAGRALHFWLSPKTKQKTQGYVHFLTQFLIVNREIKATH